METTIKINQDVKSRLNKMKLHQRETYNDIIWWLLEDHMEINEKTKKELKERRENPEFVSHEEVERMFGL